jgi:hypothetical protein
MRKLGVTPETLERPIERPHEPRRAVLLAGQRRASPLHRGVQEPDAGKVERIGYVRDLVHIRRTRADEPALRKSDRATAPAGAPLAEKVPRHASRKARALAGFCKAWRVGPPSRTSTTGMAGKGALIAMSSTSSPTRNRTFRRVHVATMAMRQGQPAAPTLAAVKKPRPCLRHRHHRPNYHQLRPNAA